MEFSKTSFEIFMKFKFLIYSETSIESGNDTPILFILSIKMVSSNASALLSADFISLNKVMFTFESSE